MCEIVLSLKTIRCCVLRFLTLGVLLGLTQALAQNIPNAGTIQQQMSRDRETTLPKTFETPDLPLQDARAPSGGPRVTVKTFKFVGNTVLSTEELQSITRSFTERALEFLDLQAALHEVTQRYRELGFLVRATLPPQDINKGEVIIEVLEARLGRVLLDPSSSSRVSAERVRRTIEASQKEGERLSTLRIDKALSILSDLAGVQVQANFVEGDATGLTNLVVKVTDAQRIAVDASSDNTGSRSTGANRLSANLALNSPLGFGDQFAINSVSSSGTQYVRFSESMPVGYSGAKLGLNLSHLNYHLVTQDYAALMAKGTSDALGLDTSYPLILSKQSTLNFLMGLEGKHLVNQSQNTVVSDYMSQLFSMSLTGSSQASALTQTRSNFRLDLVGGQLDLSKSANQSADASTTKTAGRFNKFKYWVTRDQELLKGLSLYSALNGQWANKNLDSSEKFYLGGNYGVRAYPSNEAGGSLGQLASLELRSRWGSSSMFSAFYDYGRVRVNPNNDFPGASALNQYALRGYGLSYAFISSSGASLKASVATRVGKNPNPTSAGNDQDGSLVKNRLWLNATVPF
jgi:hemolysin activation/secretion protein